MTFEPIGVIHSEYQQPDDPHEMRQRESTVVVDEVYEEGLYRIAQNDYITVLFHIHEGGDYTLKGPRLYGEERGTFACRSPHRPNPIGSTTVELLERDGRKLRVQGLDAIDGTPLLDLKPHAPSLDCPSREVTPERRTDPQAPVRNSVRSRDIETLVFDAGALHGHYCPSLSLGVMAGVFAQRELDAASADIEDLLAIVETHDCFADGIQYATGCTFGNGRLIYRDYGKTAATLVRRSAPESGVRVHLRQHDTLESADGPVPSALTPASPESAEQLTDSRPEATFDLAGRPLKQFCNVETDVAVELPDADRPRETAVCATCNEPVSGAKTVKRDGKRQCIPCSGAFYRQLDRRGLNRVETASGPRED